MTEVEAFSRRMVGVSAVSGLVIAVGILAFWAGTNSIAPPELPASVQPAQTYEVAEGTVSRSVQVSITAFWPVMQTLSAAAPGVVTTVTHRPGDLVGQGDVIATVDLEPVVVANGTVPMFRILQEGVEGPDVAQLQELLIGQGFLQGEADGRFGPTTTSATIIWQRSIGATATGMASPGAVVFIGTLSARLAVVVTVGQRLNVGADFIQVLGDSPSFDARVSASRRAELAAGMEISIDGPDGAEWRGTLGALDPQDDGSYVGSVIDVNCAAQCDDLIPVSGSTALQGSVEIVPPTSGILVPTSSLLQLPSSQRAVTLPGGSRVVVEVVAEADGFAIVDGIEAGTKILLPAAPQQ